MKFIRVFLEDQILNFHHKPCSICKNKPNKELIFIEDDIKKMQEYIPQERMCTMQIICYSFMFEYITFCSAECVIKFENLKVFI